MVLGLSFITRRLVGNMVNLRNRNKLGKNSDEFGNEFVHLEIDYLDSSSSHVYHNVVLVKEIK